MATYVNDLRLTELATGEGSGTWGTTTNQSLELIGEALGYATQQAFGSDADATTTVADGASDPARAMYYKITSAASLTATRTLTIAPNTISRVMFIENATSGSQSIAISQGSGASVTIAAGKTAVVYLDGAGATAAVVDAMAGVDPGVTDTLTEVLVAGNTSGGTNIELSTTDKVQFRDAAIYLNSSVDGQLDIVADTEIQIAATTVDLNGNLDVSGTALVTGVLTTTAATVFNGGFASNADSTLGTDKKVQFRDTAIYINSSVDGQLDIVADTEIQIATTTVDINGALDVSGTLGVTGVATLASLVATTADINAGTIDNTVIGGTTAAAISGTTGQFATSLNVDGTVTADGLTVDGAALVRSGNTLTLNRTDNAVGGAMSYVAGTGFIFNDVNGDGTSFNEGATNKFRIDSSGNVGIGTSSPSGKLDVSVASNQRIRFDDFGSKSRISSRNDAAAILPLLIDASDLILNSGSGGNVGIGTSSPDTLVQATNTSASTNYISYEIGSSGISSANKGGFAIYELGSLATSITYARDGTGHTDFNAETLVFNNAANTTEYMRIDSSGNVGIGVVPSAWSVAVPALQLGICGAFLCAQGATEALYLGSNAYYNGTNWIYAVNAPATYYRENGGAHAWFNAPSGTTGDPITFTQAMTLDASGNLLVGKSTTSFGTVGAALYASGDNDFVNDSNVMSLNRLSSDGSIITFYKDTVAVGSIGANGGVPYLSGPLAGGIKLSYYDATYGLIFPVTTTGAIANGTHDLGYSAAKFRDLYLSGGVVFGDAGGSGTSSSNTLDSYEEGTWTPTVTSSGGTITSVTSEIGTYTKIGRLVTLQYQFNIATLGTASGNIIVSGRPFTEDNTAISYYGGVHRARSGTSSITEFDPDGTLQLYGTTPVAGVYYGSMVYNTTS
jgi:hypothetical protein